MTEQTLAGLGLSLATYIGSTTVGGIIEGIAGDTFLGNWAKLRENLKQYRPEGNHEIQEAILRSYLQATLQICAVYGEDVGISVNHCILRELLPRFFAKAEVLSLQLINPDQLPDNAEQLLRRRFRELPENIKVKAREKCKLIYEKIFGASPQPLSLAESPNVTDETKWINQVIDEYTELLIQLGQKKLKFPEESENEALNELLADNSLLMQANNSHDAQEIIRQSLLLRVEKELTDEFGELPAEFRKFFIDNWFNYFCACFQYQLSKKNNPLLPKFQSKLLANIQADATEILKIFENFSGEFGERLKGIEENLAWLAVEQSAGFDEIKQLFQSAMPLIAAIDDDEARRKLVDELKPEFEQIIDELKKLKKHLDKRFDELKEILLEEKNLTPEEKKAKEDALIEEYLQAQTDKYIPAEVVGDIYGKDKFFVDRLEERENLREWIANGEKDLLLKGISGNGKTALMTEFLQEIAPDANLNHASVKAILIFYFRDESRQVDFLEICKKADARLEKANKNHSFAEQYRSFKKESPGQLPVQISDNLIKELSSLGEVLFVFDNFESAMSDRQIIDQEILVFLQNALNGTNNLRFLLTSQFLPDNETFKYKLKPFELDDLPEDFAKEFLRKKGVELLDEDDIDCGLAEASNQDLDDLLRKIVPSPMTLVSFAGYLETLCRTEGKVLKTVLVDGLDDFPDYDADDKNKGARYFIKQQYLRLSQIEQLILKALSIFDTAVEFPILKSVLPLSLEVKTILNYLKGNSLVKKVGNNRYELSPLPKDVISQLADDNISTTRRELHLKAASFYLSIRQPIAECYTQEQFEPYFNAVDHFTAAGFFDAVLSVCNESILRLLALGYMQKMIEICQPIAGHLSKPELEADNFINLGLALDSLGNLHEAITEYDKAIEIRGPLVEAGRLDLANDLARAFMNKGVALYSLGNLHEAITEYDKAIEIRGPLVEAGRLDLANDLASAFMNKGVSLASLGNLHEAITEYDKAIEIRGPLVEAGRLDLANDLAMAFMNKGVALDRLGNLHEAITEYDKAIEIRGPLVEAGRLDLANDLARAFMNKGNALYSLGNLHEAITEYDKAIEILWPLVEAGRLDLANALAWAFMNKGNALQGLGNLHEAITEYDKAIEILGPLVEAGRLDLANDLAMAFMNKGVALDRLGNLHEAITEYDNSEKVREACLDRKELFVLPEFLKNIRNRIDSLTKLEDWKRTAADVVRVFEGYKEYLEGFEISAHFKDQIKEQQDIVKGNLCEVAPEGREEIYKNAGELADAIRETVEQFCSNQVDSDK